MVVTKAEAENILKFLKQRKEKAYVLGEIAKGQKRGVRLVCNSDQNPLNILYSILIIRQLNTAIKVFSIHA